MRRNKIKIKESYEILMKTHTGEKKEYCILCHAATQYSIDTPINERNYYIEGVGQLCRKCYEENSGEDGGIRITLFKE